jgi:hypothetical protein
MLLPTTDLHDHAPIERPATATTGG